DATVAIGGGADPRPRTKDRHGPQGGGEVVSDDVMRAMPGAEHPMLQHLVDLEADYDPARLRTYDARELIRYALSTSDYWARLALCWLDQGTPAGGLEDALLELESEPQRPQALRHHARRLRKAL